MAASMLSVRLPVAACLSCRKLSLLVATPKVHVIQRFVCSSVDKPVIAARKPIKVGIVEGESYSWCACGRSNTQPFCDGSHKRHPDTGEQLPTPYPILPIRFKAEKTKDYFFCACKRTHKAPMCDGTHKRLD